MLLRYVKNERVKFIRIKSALHSEEKSLKEKKILPSLSLKCWSFPRREKENFDERYAEAKNYCSINLWHENFISVLIDNIRLSFISRSFRKTKFPLTHATLIHRQSTVVQHLRMSLRWLSASPSRISLRRNINTLYCGSLRFSLACNSIFYKFALPSLRILSYKCSYLFYKIQQ